MNINTALIEARNILKVNNSNSLELDCEILMSKAINQDRKYVILNNCEELDKDKLSRFKKLVKLRLKGVQ